MTDEHQKSEKIKDNNMPDFIAKKFNWGAAYLGLIWSAVNGCFKQWFLESFAVMFISLLVLYGLSVLIEFLFPQLFIINLISSFIIPFIAIVILFIYCGIRGNRWAWKATQNKNPEDFLKSQKPWNLVAIILFSLSVVSLILQFVATALFFKTLSDAPNVEEPPTYIKSSYCKIIQSELPKAIKITNSDNSWVYELGKHLNNSENIEYVFGHDYNQSIDVEFKVENSYVGEKVTFNVVHNIPCSLEDKNCYVSAPTVQEDTSCMFFFDDQGNIEPSKKTINFINNN